MRNGPIVKRVGPIPEKNLFALQRESLPPIPERRREPSFAKGCASALIVMGIACIAFAGIAAG
jgi:hypothetical protein